MESLKHIVSMALRHVSIILCSLVPKKKNLVLCTAWYGKKYIDNPKYVYEYLLDNSNYSICWLTSDCDIYKKLKSEDKPVEMINSIKGIWKQIRAQACFSTIQMSEYKSLFMTNVIHIDLGHGHPIKDPGLKKWNTHALKVQNMYLKNNHYYGIKASSFAKQKYIDVVPGISLDHIFISDFARNDVFVDESLQEGKNDIVNQFKKGRKTIVYMPTHRSDGKKLMNMRELLPLDKIQLLCEKYNHVFVIKKHFYHRNETEDLSEYPNLLDITNVDDIDPQVLLCQADILISDYSACYIDFMLLNRPLFFYQYDYEEFQKHERSLYIPFTSLDIAPIAYNKEDFIQKLESIITSKKDIFQDRRNSFAHTYFDNINQCGGREKVKKILDKLMQKYYPKN